MIHQEEHLSKCAYTSISSLCGHVALLIQAALQSKNPTLILGGDHSVAIGTWQGVSEAKNNNIGLIWIDAHMDAHTPETSDSGNIHGMPLAVLLGYGDKKLVSRYTLDPKFVYLIGTRSYEAPEYAFLKKLGIRIYFIDEVLKAGFWEIMRDVVSHMVKNRKAFGVSLDMDVLDPSIAPGVSAPVLTGILLHDLLQGLQGLKNLSNFIAMEIVEYNPFKDIRCKTAHAIQKIIETVYPTIVGRI